MSERCYSRSSHEERRTVEAPSIVSARSRHAVSQFHPSPPSSSGVIEHSQTQTHYPPPTHVSPDPRRDAMIEILRRFRQPLGSSVEQDGRCSRKLSESSESSTDPGAFGKIDLPEPLLGGVGDQFWGVYSDPGCDQQIFISNDTQPRRLQLHRPRCHTVDLVGPGTSPVVEEEEGEEGMYRHSYYNHSHHDLTQPLATGEPQNVPRMSVQRGRVNSEDQPNLGPPNAYRLSRGNVELDRSSSAGEFRSNHQLAASTPRYYLHKASLGTQRHNVNSSQTLTSTSREGSRTASEKTKRHRTNASLS